MGRVSIYIWGNTSEIRLERHFLSFKGLHREKGIVSNRLWRKVRLFMLMVDTRVIDMPCSQNISYQRSKTRKTD